MLYDAATGELTVVYTPASSTVDPTKLRLLSHACFTSIFVYCLVHDFVCQVQCQIELAILLDVGVRGDSARAHALTGLVLCLRT